MTDKNKSLNLLIEKERNETNEQLLIENKDLKQRIITLLAYISSLESKLNNLYHKEEKEAKNTVKLSPEEYERFEEGFKKMMEERSKRRFPFERIIFGDDEEVEYRGCAQMSLEQIKRDELKKIAGENLLSYESTILFPPFNTVPFPEIMKKEGEENKNE